MRITDKSDLLVGWASLDPKPMSSGGHDQGPIQLSSLSPQEGSYPIRRFRSRPLFERHEVVPRLLRGVEEMAAIPEVSVTLSDAMWKHLRRRAAGLGVSVELLVAGLVCDTIEGLADGRVRLLEKQALQQLMDIA
jgi:hypothetical protein